MFNTSGQETHRLYKINVQCKIYDDNSFREFIQMYSHINSHFKIVEFGPYDYIT